MARELRTVMNEDVEWMDDIAEKVERDVQPVFKRYMEAGEEERAAMEVCAPMKNLTCLMPCTDPI